MKLKKRFFCNSVGNLFFLGAAYAAPALHMHAPKNTLGAAYAAPTALYNIFIEHIKMYWLKRISNLLIWNMILILYKDSQGLA